MAVVGIVAPAVRKEEELKRKEEEDLQVLAGFCTLFIE